jgi:hypothetical protein
MIVDDNGDGVPEVNRPLEIDALIHSVKQLLADIKYPMEKKRVVWVMDDRIYHSGTEYRVFGCGRSWHSVSEPRCCCRNSARTSSRQWMQASFACTCGHGAETVKLTAQVETAIRNEVPPGEIAGILNNIGIPSGGIPLTYIDNGLIGTGDADILVSLRPGHRPTDEYVRRLRLRLHREFPGVMFYFLPTDIVSQTINFGLPAPFDIQIMGRDQTRNRAIAARLADKLRYVPGVVDVRVQQPADLPRLQVAVDRTKASELGLTEQNVAMSMLLGLSGSSQVQPMYWLDPRRGIQYLVNVRVPEYAIDSLAALQVIPMEGSQPGEGDVQLLDNLFPRLTHVADGVGSGQYAWRTPGWRLRSSAVCSDQG